LSDVPVCTSSKYITSVQQATTVCSKQVHCRKIINIIVTNRHQNKTLDITIQPITTITTVALKQTNQSYVKQERLADRQIILEVLLSILNHVAAHCYDNMYGKKEQQRTNVSLTLS